MFLQAPQETPYDLRFHLLGFPVRVSWSFWLGAVIIGYDFARAVDRFAFFREISSPGSGPLLLLWTLCVLVSILIHELGHALAFRQFGIQSSIVLYHFGGYAEPIGSFRGVSVNRLSEKQDLWITAAGPLLQLLSAGVVIALLKLGGYRITAFEFMPGALKQVPGMLKGDELLFDSLGLGALALFYVFPSVAWALLNLMPVWPLDGGRIMRSLVLLNGGNTSQSLWISIVTAGGLAYFAFHEGQTIMAIFFLMFAINNYQMLQQPGGWR